MVDFALNEEQKMMLDMARDFARTEIRPLADKYYRQGQKIPHEALDEVLKKANGLRLIDYYFPTELGGLGVTDKLITCLMVEELCWGDAGIAIHIVASGLCAKAIEAMGTPEQNKRWVVIEPPGAQDKGAKLLLARGVGPEQTLRIGNQTGGRVFLFLDTDDLWRDYRSLTARGVRFVRPPKEENYGTVAVFEDLYGNRWDLLQLREPAQPGL